MVVYHAIKNYGRFTTDMKPARAEFWRMVCDLTQADATVLRFDGEYFDCGMRRHYREFSRARRGADQVIEVNEEWKPHSVSWRYTRIGGGPDRRYASNPRTLSSRRVEVRLDGSATDVLYAYEHPSYGGEVGKAVEKINRMLAPAAAGLDYEEIFQQFEAVYLRTLPLRSRIDAAEKARGSLGAILREFQALPAEAKQNREVKARRDRAEAELRDVLTMRGTLDLEHQSLVGEMSKLISDAHAIIERGAAKRAVEAFLAR